VFYLRAACFGLYMDHHQAKKCHHINRRVKVQYAKLHNVLSGTPQFCCTVKLYGRWDLSRKWAYNINIIFVINYQKLKGEGDNVIFKIFSDHRPYTILYFYLKILQNCRIPISTCLLMIVFCSLMTLDI